MRNRGFSKHKLSQWFSEVKYSNRAKFLAKNPINACQIQGTRETEGEPLLIKIIEEIFTEGTMEETILDNFEGSTEGVSEEEGDIVSMVELDYLNGLLSEGRSTAMYPSLLSTTKNEKIIPAKLTVLSPKQTTKTRRCVVSFQAQRWT